MRTPYELWPIMLLEDRYSGTYSGGSWLAIARYFDWDVEAGVSRLTLVEKGAQAGDCEAAMFGERIAEIPWIAVGSSPDGALRSLLDKHFTATNGMTPSEAERGEFGRRSVTRGAER